MHAGIRRNPTPIPPTLFINSPSILYSISLPGLIRPLSVASALALNLPWRLSTSTLHNTLFPYIVKMSNSTAPEKYLSTSEGNITPANTIAVGAVLPILGFFAVAARFYGRKHVNVVFLGADDWLILVSLVRQFLCYPAFVSILIETSDLDDRNGNYDDCW